MSPADDARDESPRSRLATGDRFAAVLTAAEQAASQLISDAEQEASQFREQARDRASRKAQDDVRSATELAEAVRRQAEVLNQQSDALVESFRSTQEQIEQGPLGRLEAGDTDVIEADSIEAPAREPQPPAPEPEQPEPEVEPEPEPEPPSEPEPSEPPAPEPADVEEPQVAADEPSPEPDVGEPEPPPPEPVAAKPEPEPARGGGGDVSPGARLLAIQMSVAGSSREEIEQRLRDEFGVTASDELLDELFS